MVSKTSIQNGNLEYSVEIFRSQICDRLVRNFLNCLNYSWRLCWKISARLRGLRGRGQRSDGGQDPLSTLQHWWQHNRGSGAWKIWKHQRHRRLLEGGCTFYWWQVPLVQRDGSGWEWWHQITPSWNWQGCQLLGKSNWTKFSSIFWRVDFDFSNSFLWVPYEFEKDDHLFLISQSKTIPVSKYCELKFFSISITNSRFSKEKVVDYCSGLCFCDHRNRRNSTLANSSDRNCNPR